MRRAQLLAAAAGAALILASCGGDSTSDPLAEALGVLPADAPLAIAISTDLEGESYRDLDAALQRFGVEGGLDSGLEQLDDSGVGISFARDVQPLLGNDLVMGIASAAGGPADEGEGLPVVPFVTAIEVSDGDAVRELLSDAGLEEIDQLEGASVYGEAPSEDAPEDAPPQGAGVAVDGDLVVAAESNRELEQALAQRGEDDRLTEAIFADHLGELPGGGIVRATGDVPSVLQALGIEQIATLPWVKSLRSYGLTVDVDGRTLTVDAELSGEEVAENELPLDPGPDSPRVLKERPTVATRDQAQTVVFALAAIRAAVPQAAFEEVTDRLQRRLDGGAGSVSSLIDQFGEGLVIRLSDEATVTRSVVQNPAAVANALKSLRDEVPLLARLGGSSSAAGQALEAARYAIPALPVGDPGFFPSGSKVREIAGMPDLYRLRPALPPGEPRVGLQYPQDEFVFGLIDGVFVTAPSLKTARKARNAEPSDADLPPGALAFRIPVKASDLQISGADVGVTVTTVEGGVEASSTGLRLRAQAGL